jgi:hypothetical protein
MINIDAAPFQATLTTGPGVVIQNHSAEVLVAFSQSVDGIDDPEMAKGIAVREVLLVVLLEGFQKVVASDQVCMIQADTITRDMSSVSVVVVEILSLNANSKIALLFMFAAFVMKRLMF